MFNFLDAFKAGKILANAAGWKDVQIATNYLVVIINVLLAFAKMFFDIPEVPQDKVAMISGGIAAIVNIFLTYATTKKTLIGQKEPEQESTSPTLAQDNTGG